MRLDGLDVIPYSLPFRDPYITARGQQEDRELILIRVYGLVFGPLDSASRRLWRGVDVDGFSVTALANMGLSTQLAALGICLALGAPEAYLWVALAGLLAVASLRLRAELRARRLREA